MEEQTGIAILESDLAELNEIKHESTLWPASDLFCMYLRIKFFWSFIKISSCCRLW